MQLVRACRRRLVEIFEQNWERRIRGPQALDTLENRVLFAAVPGVIGGGDGLTGTYFNNMDLTAQVLQRTDAVVDFNWGSGAPDASIGADTFSVRWTGYIQPRYGETYTFRTTSDDGVRLWVNDQLLINEWTNHSATDHTGSITLEAGQFYSIRMEHYENAGGAVATLAWQSASQISQVIPQTQLFTQPPLAVPTDPIRRELEQFTGSSAWQTTTEGGVTYRNVPNGSTGTEQYNNAETAPRVTTSFEAAAASYEFRARFSTATEQDNSFWIRVNGGEWVFQDVRPSAGAPWTEVVLDVPRTAHAGGQMVIEIAARETGAKLDWIEAVPVGAPPNPGILALAATQLRVRENAGHVAVDVIRVGGTLGEATVTYQTVNDSALSGSDYAGVVSGTLTFADGQSRATILIPILNDGGVEGDEKFALSLNGVTGAGLSEPRTCQITITDDDNSLPDALLRQAENFTRGGGWVTGVSGATTYVSVPDGAPIERQDDPDAAPRISDTFNLAPGEYTIRGRFRALDGGDNSFYVRFNGAGEWVFIDVPPQGNVFTIQQLIDLGTIDHPGGALTIEIAQREAGTEIDYIEFVPVGGPTTTPTFGLGKAEAEAMLLQNMLIAGKGFASGGSINEVGYDGSTGTSEFKFNGPTGSYNLELAYFDENDGAGTYRVLVNGIQVVGFVANATDGGPGADEASYRTRAFSGILLNNGDEVTIEVTAEGSEAGRIDYLRIVSGVPDNGTFGLQNVISGLNNPTAMDFTKNGTMFISQKNGIVRIFKNGALQTANFIDIRSQVNDTRDRGLLGVAIHPDFENNPYVYLAFTYDPPETQGRTGLAAPDGNGNRTARVIRVTAQTSPTGVITAVPGSEVVIVGKNSTWANISRPDGNSTSDITIPQSGVDANGNYIQDFINSDSESHTIGAIEFGADGALYVSIGDGASYGFTDPRAARVQSLDSLSGKLLRVDAMTGEGLSDNPFYNGDPNSNRSKVFAYGMRNPFRIATHPTEAKTVYVGDVGWTKWEEINHATGGENFGWPWYEGAYNSQPGPYLERTGGYRDLAAAQQFYNSTANADVDAPAWASNHADGTIAIVMGDFISSPLYPSKYQGQVFFSDFGVNDVQVAYLDANGNVTSVETVVDGGERSFTEMTMGPDGYLYVTDLYGGTISRLNYA